MVQVYTRTSEFECAFQNKPSFTAYQGFNVALYVQGIGTIILESYTMVVKHGFISCITTSLPFLLSFVRKSLISISEGTFRMGRAKLSCSSRWFADVPICIDGDSLLDWAAYKGKKSFCRRRCRMLQMDCACDSGNWLCMNGAREGWLQSLDPLTPGSAREVDSGL